MKIYELNHYNDSIIDKLAFVLSYEEPEIVESTKVFGMTGFQIKCKEIN